MRISFPFLLKKNMPRFLFLMINRSSFLQRINNLFGKRSSVRKGGRPFIRRIEILSGKISSVRTEDR